VSRIPALANTVLRPKSETRGFRPDIQGLRAIAVLLVALAHARVSWLQGGYVGVDVFFVISGFLITGFLLRRAEQSGRVPFAEFYAARRILPAATLTIVVTVVASWHYLNYIRALSAFHDAIWSAFFAANIHFSHIATNYFAQDNPPSPFQHFWTLAVEEQFYIVWPALLAVLLLAARKRRRLLIAATAGLCVASLVYSVRYTATNPAAAYFSTLARAWELGLGALIAMLAAELGRLPATLRAGLTWIGVAAIIVAGVEYSSGTQFPGYAALLPVLGSGLVIAGGLGGAPRFGVGAILRFQPFQFIGDVSYAFYLWHWPAIAIAGEYLGHQLSVLQNLGLLAVAFAVSAFTYLTFENPIRHAKTLSMPRAALALWPATVALVLVLANVAISSQPALAVNPRPTPIVPEPLPSYHRLVVKSATPARLAQPIPKAVLPLVASVQYHDLPNLKGCPLRTMRFGGTCVLGDPHATRSFAVLGDSHANAWMSALDYFARQHHYRLIGLTRDGCTIGTVTGNHPACTPLWARWLRQLSSENVKFLVVSQRWDTRLQAQQLYDDQNLELTKFDRLVPRTIVMEDVPYHPLINTTDCLLRSGATLGDCTLTWTADTTAEYAAMRSIVQSHPKDRLLPTRSWFCAGNKCPLVIGDMIVYRDYQHITDTYARHLAPAVSHSLLELTTDLQ
jgi:peptidoglycan/LPS O-acetylase OafA/YrhL